MLAVLLGFGLLLARTGPDHPVIATQPESVLASVEAKDDHVLPVDLAKRIIEGRKDFTLVDVRSAWEFDDYHIQGAVNLPLPQLLGASGKEVLRKDREIILYSSGGAHAAQAWVLLSQQGYTVKTLLDGLDGWWRDVMTPVCLQTRGDSSDALEYQGAKAIREFFQGGSATPGSPAVPSTSAPAPAAPAAPRPSRKKSGGGC
jgi:rhodanese-related sulfurtransferase